MIASVRMLTHGGSGTLTVGVCVISRPLTAPAGRGSKESGADGTIIKHGR
jgi:hypothetical protein